MEFSNFLNHALEECNFATDSYNQMLDNLNEYSSYRRRLNNCLIKGEDKTKLDGYDKFNSYNPILNFKKNLIPFLIHSANVSKIFWPPKNSEAKKRGSELIKKLQLDENHILKDRELRNHFEHYDERLDQWEALEGVSVKINFSIGDKPPKIQSIFHESVTSNIGDYFLFYYDKTNNTGYFRGEKFDFNEYYKGIKDIKEKIEYLLNIN